MQSRREEKLETSETPAAAAAAAVWGGKIASNLTLEKESRGIVTQPILTSVRWSASKFEVAASVALSKCIPQE